MNKLLSLINEIEDSYILHLTNYDDFESILSLKKVQNISCFKFSSSFIGNERTSFFIEQKYIPKCFENTNNLILFRSDLLNEFDWKIVETSLTKICSEENLNLTRVKLFFNVCNEKFINKEFLDALKTIFNVEIKIKVLKEKTSKTVDYKEEIGLSKAKHPNVFNLIFENA